MFGKSKRVRALEAALERQRGVSERWREDWEASRRELAQAKMKLTKIRCLKVHTDADGKRYVYVDGVL